MAKPKLPSIPEHSATSSVSHRHTSSPPQASSSRSKSRSARSLVPSGPSTSLLAILASVVASTSSVDGHPIGSDSPPPDFLCPFLITQEPPPPSNYRQTVIRRADSEDVQATPSDYYPRFQRSGFVPDKYVQGTDGRWRKSTWSLYGSAYCKTTQCPSDPEDTSVPVVDDQVNATQAPSPTESSSVPDMQSSNLPQGWKVRTDDDHISTAIILVLSLVLAALMCVFIIGCVTWRKKRRKLLEKDLEKKERRSQDGSDDEDSEEVKLMKAQQRLWSKATAKWKAGVRLSARRRRGKRQAAKESIAHSSSHSLSRSLTSSPNQSRVTIASGTFEEHETDSLASRHEDSNEDGQLTPDSTVPSSPPSTHPPAYHHRASAAIHSSAHTTQSSDHLGAPSDDHRNEDQLPYTPPSDGAHVATDDKRILFQLASLASAPPSSPTSVSQIPSAGTTSEVAFASVPAMEEVEEIEISLAFLAQNGPEVGCASTTSGPFTSVSSSEDCFPAPSYEDEGSPEGVFPPPPSKSALASASFYEHPTFFEADVVGIDPIEGPSAPPFEAIGPSAPPLDDPHFLDTIPSAPPIPFEESLEHSQVGEPSAPTLSDDDTLMVSRTPSPAP